MEMYYVALVLPEELNREVQQFKELMRDRWNCKVGLKSPAHITFVPPFWMDASLERSLLQDLDLLCEPEAPFPVRTQNFSAFKPRTLFIALTPNREMDELKKKSDAFFGSRSEYGIRKENRAFHPHITIATRDLHKKDFAEAWPFFADKEYERDWKAGGLSLLRHNKKNWDVIHTSQFKIV